MRKMTIVGVIIAMTAGLVLGLAALPAAPTRVAEANAGTQWNASYWNNTDLSGSPVVTRIDDQINFNWASGSPGTGINTDNFSARWTKTVNFPNSGEWTFRVGADDGIRMWIDVTPIVNEWHSNPEGFKTYQVTIGGLTAGNHDLKVEYYESTGNAGAIVAWWFGGGSGGGGTSQTGAVYGPANWTGNYFNNKDLTGSPVLTRTDGDINFDWGAGSPGTNVPVDNFSVRWTTTFNFPAPGRWHFQVGADDGIRMWIDVTQIVNEWHGNPEGFKTYDVDVYALTAGNHDLKVEYYEATGNARVSVRWWQGDASGATAGTAVPPTATPIPPTVVFAAVTGDNVNVRSGPGEGNPVIGQLPFAKNYLVLGAVPDMSWLKIDLGNGSTGWVSNKWVWLYSTDDKKNQDTTKGGQPDFVDTIPRLSVPIAPPAQAPENPPATVLHGQANDTVNLRDGPSLYNAVVIGTLPGGATFDVEARSVNGSWYLIAYQGIRGWVNASFVSLHDGTPNDLVASSEVVPQPPPGAVFVPESAPGVPAVTVRGRANSNLHLRDAASLRGKDVGSVDGGTEFVIEGRNSNGAWYLVTINGTQGWINAAYVTLIEGTVSDLVIR